MREPIHPGETLREDLDALGMSASELARRIEVPANRITGILNGQRAVTGDTALRLGRFFGTSGEFWLNLQKLYELRCAERESGAAIGLLPTLLTGSKETDKTMASAERGAASAPPSAETGTRPRRRPVAPSVRHPVRGPRIGSGAGPGPPLSRG